MTLSIATTPCAKCPFKDGDWLRRERRKEISDDLKRDNTFYCHATVDYETEIEDEEENNGQITDSSKECVGAHILSDRSGFASQMHRISERLGMVPEKINDKTIPWRNLDDWVDQGGEDPADEDFEPCNVVGPNCIAPAGFMVAGGIIEGDEPATTECVVCGDPSCEECVDEEGICVYCTEED